ncbi:MAG: zinc-dependent alcohol dehydrogenase family protein [Bacteroidota bacterium]
MKAIWYDTFQGPLTLKDVPDPSPSAGGVVLKVEATGLCRSDWHGWMGHDADIVLPHVPGHELAGIVVEVGQGVKNWQEGDRVTVPFVGGCGHCEQCHSGNHQVCDNQFQPGFTAWGSFAEYVAIDYADINLVKLPEEIDFNTAASLGCRFITSFRGVVHQGKVGGGDWVAVYGCGGVGLSAIMIANALGANVIAVDIDNEKLAFATSLGAHITVNSQIDDAVSVIKEVTSGGVRVSIDALGSKATCYDSIASLRKRGKHVQIGLLAGEETNPAVPMHLVVANELEILGSHGMQAHEYKGMLEMIKSGKLQPQKLIGASISLADAVTALPEMNKFTSTGVTVINKF